MQKENIICYPSPEEFLGANSKRYFSSNYKRITHEITNLIIQDHVLIGRLNIKWPNLWAEKAGKKLKPHVGSLEFYVIAVQFVEHYMTIVDNVRKDCVKKIWVEDFISKAGSEAVEESSDIACKCKKLSQTYNEGVVRSSFVIEIGKATVKLTIRYETCIERKCLSSCNNSSCVSIDSILAVKNSHLSYYDLGYKVPMHKITNIEVNKESESIIADVELINSELASNFVGISSLFQPCFTYCDIILITGQLSQILLFTLDNLTRENASNLWMRSVDCKYYNPIIGTARFKLCVKEFKKINTAGRDYRTTTLFLDFGDGNMTSICKFAYQL